MRRVPVSLLFAACIMSIPCHGEEAAAAIGKRFAVDSGISWDMREIDHAVLGPIQFAARKNEVVTAVRGEKIFSNAYVSCQRKTGTIALELTNAPSSAPDRGLGPVELPRLVCNSPGPQGAGVVKTEIAASWEIGALGDTLARGLSSAALRRCVSIDVLQNLALPTAWRQESQRVGLQITPYARELDAVFVRCGETTAFAKEDPRPVAAATATAPRLTPAPANDRNAPRDAPWKAARTIAAGRTNVRAAASVDSRLVIQLDPGAKILVQAASPPWFRVKPVSGPGFAGYIRQDRLEIE